MPDFRSDYYTALPPQADDWVAFLADREPTAPDTQRRFTGKHGVGAFTEALETVDAFLEQAAALDRPVRAGDRLMDFGCGWGRITKAAARYFEPENITGVDISAEALDFARASPMPVRLEQCHAGQPLPLDAGSVDFVFAYSVFSHLKEEAARHWMDEFRRVLVPGGIVAVTTRPRGFISWCAQLREKDDLPAHARGSDAAFLDTQDALARYDAGEFVFDGERMSGPLKGAGYGEACIPEGYVDRVWDNEFDRAVFVPGHRAKTNQSLILCRK